VICVERVDAALTRQPRPDEGRGALRPEIAPVWEMVEAGIRRGETYAPSFYILLATAAMIGAVGLLTNSQILIVGAMVVGPEYNAIMGVALGISRRVRNVVLLNVFLLIVVGAAGLSAQRAIWRRRRP
jgi:hypothetical protein